MKEKTINICNRDVAVGYCAATEKGFEQLTGKSIADLNINAQGDVLSLCISAIVAAAEKHKAEPTITADDLLYEASPQDIITLGTTVFELRNEWYGIPAVVKQEETEQHGKEEAKNA